jgi:hypothetical protein
MWRRYLYRKSAGDQSANDRRIIMGQQPFDGGQDSRILTQVYEGMDVYDRTGDKIGTVEYIYLGAVSEEADKYGAGPATASERGSREISLIEDFAKVFSAEDRVPEPLRERLRRHGFMRIDSTGLFAADRYVMPDQIADVSGDRVTLRVTQDELIKR